VFGIGETELVIIVVFAFLLFGPDKLPGMGRTLGRMLRQFREASDGFTEVVQTSIMDPAAEELERPDLSPKQRRREAQLEAEAKAQAQAQASAGEGGEAAQAQAATETAEVAPEPPRRETFAERKARLLAERQAREAAQAQAAAAAKAEAEAGAETAGDAGADGSADAAAAPKAEVTGPVAPGREKAVPTTRSAADLYAMGGQHSSRFRAPEQEAAEEGDPASGVPNDESDAKEEGGER
jgi:TatA/E family protein of Tat protein translocase